MRMHLEEIKEILKPLLSKDRDWSAVDQLSPTEKMEFIEKVINSYPEHKDLLLRNEKRALILLLEKLNGIDYAETLQVKLTEFLTALKKEVEAHSFFQRYQEDQAARKLQSFFAKNVGTTQQKIKWQLAVIEKRKLDPARDPSRTMYPSEISKRFSYIKHLGSGWNGDVYEVFDKKTNQARAYKKHGVGRDQHVRHDIQVIVGEALDKGYTPHLTRIIDVFRLRESSSYYKNNAILDRKNNIALETFLAHHHITLQEYKKLLDNPETKALVYGDLTMWKYGGGGVKRGITLMEKLDGDVATVRENLTSQDSLAMKIQLASTQYIMQNIFHTIAYDEKDENTFYKRLSDSDMFQGKKLIEYDYWLYKIGEYQLYIPRSQYLFKFGDYDGWIVSSEKDNPHRFRSDADILTQYLGRNFKNICETFKKPEGVDDSRILNMSPPYHQEFDSAKEPEYELVRIIIREGESLDLKHKKTGKSLLELILSNSKTTREDIAFIFDRYPNIYVTQRLLHLAQSHLNEETFNFLYDYYVAERKKLNDQLNVLNSLHISPLEISRDGFPTNGRPLNDDDFIALLVSQLEKSKITLINLLKSLPVEQYPKLKESIGNKKFQLPERESDLIKLLREFPEEKRSGFFNHFCNSHFLGKNLDKIFRSDVSFCVFLGLLPKSLWLDLIVEVKIEISKNLFEWFKKNGNFSDNKNAFFAAITLRYISDHNFNELQNTQQLFYLLKNISDDDKEDFLRFAGKNKLKELLRNPNELNMLFLHSPIQTWPFISSFLEIGAADQALSIDRARDERNWVGWSETDKLKFLLMTHLCEYVNKIPHNTNHPAFFGQMSTDEVITPEEKKSVESFSKTISSLSDVVAIKKALEDEIDNNKNAPSYTACLQECLSIMTLSTPSKTF